MASYRENEAFSKSIISSCLLDEAIEWLRANMNPDDVFDECALEEWAYENGFKKPGDESE